MGQGKRVRGAGQQGERFFCLCSQCGGEVYVVEEHCRLMGEAVCCGCFPKFMADYCALSRQAADPWWKGEFK